MFWDCIDLFPVARFYDLLIFIPLFFWSNRQPGALQGFKENRPMDPKSAQDHMGVHPSNQ